MSNYMFPEEKIYHNKYKVNIMEIIVITKSRKRNPIHCDSALKFDRTNN